MKKLLYLSIFVAILLVPKAYAQKIGNLNGIYYQAVALDDVGKEIVGTDITGKPLYQKAIGVRFTISKGLNGEKQWEETHTTNTDKFGLFNLIIGQGTKTAGGKYAKMLDIPWIDADQFLKVEISTKNDGNYKVVSNQQFMSVPYSFYTDDIADDAILTEKIRDSAILNRDISTSAIDSRTILNETILAEDIDTSAVTTSEILDSTILNRDIRTGSVDSRTILDSTIINRDLQTGSVDSRVILDSTIINRDIQTSAVDSRIILDSSVINIDINTGAVNSRTILDNSIVNVDIADSTIDLTTKVIGVLPVGNGGLGTDSLLTNSLLIGNGKGAIKSLGKATNGQIPVGVTDTLPQLKTLAGKNGIDVNITQDSIIISSGIAAFFTDTIQGIDAGFIGVNTSWVSPPLLLAGVEMGDIVHGGLNKDIAGCQLTIFVSEPNRIRISLFNGTTNNVVLNDMTLKVMVVK